MITNILSGFGMIVAGVLFFVIPRQRLHTRWSPLFFGALTWIIAIALKFAWAVPLNSPIYLALRGVLGEPAGPYVFYAYVGLLTGVFECGLIYLVVRFLPLFATYDGRKGLAFGYGFGAIEALLLGLAVLVGALVSVYAPGTLPGQPPAELGTIDWLALPVGTVERIATVFVHAFTTLLIFHAIGTHRIGWFLVAFFFKSALDAVAAWAQLDYGIKSLDHIWTIEAVVLVFGAVSVWGLFAIGWRWPAPSNAGAGSRQD